MSHDPVRVEDTQSWMSKADYDLRSARHALKASPPLTADAVFHCQQAAEKAIKAFLTWHDILFRKTHNLEEISQDRLHVDPTLEPTLKSAAPLTEYAWKYRYPGDPDSPPEEEARLALRLAESVVNEIFDRLPSDDPPAVTGNGG